MRPGMHEFLPIETDRISAVLFTEHQTAAFCRERCGELNPRFQIISLGIRVVVFVGD